MDAAVGFLDTPTTPTAPAHRDWRPWAVFAVLVVATVLTRMSEVNNPLTHVDDQFYLLTGSALLHGELPYVDIWDRKPIGLFLIYAAIAALKGDSVINYHLIGAAFALATAWVIARFGRRLAGWRGGTAAGLTYLALLPMLGGAGGQSPVFYNLPMVIAARLAFDVWTGERRLWPGALAAMALVGLAIQIKPTVVVEGAAFGLLLLAAAWRAEKSWRRLFAVGAAMAALTALPTLAALAAYAALGHAGEMWTATVVSIFHKASLPLVDRVADVPQILLYLTVPALVAASGLATLWARSERRNEATFLSAWAAAALLGFLAVPNFFNHYSLPLLVPMAVLAAVPLADRRDGTLLLAATLVLPLLTLAQAPDGLFAGRAGFDRVAATVRHELRGGCLYVYLGPTALYTATHACRVTPYVFPDHLESEVEATALPVSPEAEVERVFARHPAVVVNESRFFLRRNNRTAAIVEQHLWCDYRLDHSFKSIGGKHLDIWALKAGPRPPCSGPHPPLGIIQPPRREVHFF